MRLKLVKPPIDIDAAVVPHGRRETVRRRHAGPDLPRVRRRVVDLDGAGGVLPAVIGRAAEHVNPAIDPRHRLQAEDRRGQRHRRDGVPGVGRRVVDFAGGGVAAAEDVNLGRRARSRPRSSRPAPCCIGASVSQAFVAGS